MSTVHVTVRPLFLARKKRPVRTSCRIAVEVSHLQPHIVDEFLEFLELIYGTHPRVCNRDNDAIWVSIPNRTMSPAGVRVAGRLYDVTVHLVDWPVN